MNCPSCNHPNKTYLDYCEMCHVALDGSGLYEHGHSSKGVLPPSPEPRDVPWVFLVVSIALWISGGAWIFMHLIGRTNKNTFPTVAFYLLGLGAMSYAKYRHEKTKPIQ